MRQEGRLKRGGCGGGYERCGGRDRVLEEWAVRWTEGRSTALRRDEEIHLIINPGASTTQRETIRANCKQRGTLRWKTSVGESDTEVIAFSISQVLA